MNRLSLRARVALLAAAAVGVAVALATGAAYLTLRHELRHQIDASLVARAEAAADTSLGDPGLLVRIPSAALGAADVRVAIVRADGTPFVALEEGAVPAGEPEVAVARGQTERSLRTTTLDGVPYRVVAVPVSPGFALVLARSLSEPRRILRQVTIVLLGVGLLGVAVAATAGMAVARAGLAPVNRLTGAAERVARTGELEPIEVTGRDEIARLASAFNAMLAALGESRERQRQLVADAGHELRTPLTSLRTNLDLLAQAGDRLPPQERAHVLADVRAQSAELTDLVTDLVTLARDQPEPAAEDVDLVAVVERAVDRVRRRGTGVRFDVSTSPWHLRGNPRLLERAVTNLLDNAVKWSPPGGTVRVTLHDGVLRVADEGPGIAEEDLPRIFDRFYRADDARAMPGSGLGLAIVRQVAEQHGGSAEASRGYGGGALLTLRLTGRATTS